MNLQYRRPSIKLQPTSWLLSFISITILTSIVKGSHSHTAELTNTINQRIYSDLTGKIREFSSIKHSNNTDQHFQSPVDSYDQDQVLWEGYLLMNPEDLISSSQITTPDEGSTSDITTDGSGFTTDGSGITIEETTTSVTVTDTTQSTITVHLTSSNFPSSDSTTPTDETTSEVPTQSSTSSSSTTEQITSEISS
ncbi:unnamed protein product, partial [Rotaria sordida]